MIGTPDGGRSPKIQMYAGTRKSTATDALIKSNGNMEKVSKFLGHSTPEITRKHYAKFDVELLRDLVSDPEEQQKNNVTKIPSKRPMGHQKRGYIWESTA